MNQLPRLFIHDSVFHFEINGLFFSIVKSCFHFSELQKLATMSKMSLIQPVMFRTLKMGYFKMSYLQTFHLQMAIFQMGLQLPQNF